MFIIELIQSIFLIISAILIIISAIGFVTLDKNMDNLIYARIHVAGVFDIAFILAMLGLQQYLLAGIYLVIAPFTAHAIANAFYNSEDKVNNLQNKNVEVESSKDENPFVHNINDVKKMENESNDGRKDNIKFSISTLEISEDE
ncbi:cation:proton antiporter [uncultured Methanobrevibacter sp.]|uniref:cation:proton antiporter n=1 Tax=uncultured Methanobrevibacter sp. TaxID=253161 RepID=UPI0026344435|nr:cation:proton antiporter [uncultured Methanobrevibacter sp.]